MTTTTAQPLQPTAEVAADGASVLVRFAYNPQLVKLVKKVPTHRFVSKDKPEGPAWRLDLNLPTMRRLREHLGDQLVLGPELAKWGLNQVEKERNLSELSDANDAQLSRVSPKLHKWLRPYQRADVQFMAQQNVLCANQPRTGKTPTLITAVWEAELEWAQHLVFAPKASLNNTWRKGILEVYYRQQGGVPTDRMFKKPADKWTAEDFETAIERKGYDMPTVLTGRTPKERRAAIAEAKEMAEAGYAFWLVLNPAMAQMKRQQVEGTSGDDIQYEEVLKHPELIEVDWDTMTIDEFHLMGLSNPTTLGAMGVNYIAEATQPVRRYALSGTPMKGKPIKLWGALHFLNPEEFTSRWNWARHWLVIRTEQHNQRGDTHSKIEGLMPGREADFYEHLKPYLVRRTQKDALPGLPPMNRVPVMCDMTPKQREQYIQFATEAEWRLDSAEEEGRLTATNVLAEYTRLKQFAGAYCEVKRGKLDTKTGDFKLLVQATPDSGKLEQLMEKLAEENVLAAGPDDDEPKAALVFSQHNGMCKMVAEQLEAQGVPVARLVAGKDTANDKAVDAFKAGGPTAPRVLVMNTLMGTALTLDRAESVHLLDETWVPDDQEQAENRATPTTEETMARPSTGSYYYRTAGTIDEYVRNLVADKAMNNRTILDLRRRMQAELAKVQADGNE